MRRIAGRHMLWTIGSTRPPRALPTPRRRFAARLGQAWLTAAALRPALRQTLTDIDLIACWSPSVLSAVHAAVPRSSVPSIGIFTNEPSLSIGPLEHLARRAALDRATIFCTSPAFASEWRHAGAIDVRAATPFVRFDPADLPTRQEARAELAIKPHERVLALFADPPSLGDARRFAYLTGLLSVGGTPTVGLVHARSAQIRRSARFLRECGRAWRFVAYDGPLTDFLAAADAVFADVRVSPTHPLRSFDSTVEPRATADSLAASIAAAAEVPLIIPRTSLANDLVQAGHSLHVAADLTPLSFAASMLAVLEKRAEPRSAPQPPVDDAIDQLHEVCVELANVPSPGFPLAPSAVPPPSFRPPSRATGSTATL